MRGGKADAKPRGRMTAYAYFVQTCREEHKKKHPDESVIFAEFSRKCAERWKVSSRCIYTIYIHIVKNSTSWLSAPVGRQIHHQGRTDEDLKKGTGRRIDFMFRKKNLFTTDQSLAGDLIDWNTYLLTYHLNICLKNENWTDFRTKTVGDDIQLDVDKKGLMCPKKRQSWYKKIL